MDSERPIPRVRVLLVGLALSAFASGCASVPRDAGFAEVAALARERGGYELAWRRGGPEDAELDRRVRALAAEELTLESAVEIALLSNRRLQALYAELGFAQADILAAARLPNPLLHAELRFPEGGGRSALDLGIEQSFLSLLWMPLKKRRAADAFEAAKLRVAGGALALSSEVRAAYRRLQGSAQLVELARTSLEAAEASFELARRLHAAGNIRDLDLALERVQREEARVAAADAEFAVIEEREALAALLGLHGEEAALRVGARLPDLPPEAGATAELEARAIANSLGLAATRHEIERAGRHLDLSKHQGLVPDLTLGAVAEREGDGHWEAGPTLALPLPLFSQGQPEQRRAAAELERLRETYMADAVELRSRLRRAAARVVALHARASFLRDVLVPLRGEVLDGMQLEYNAMQQGAFRLLVAKRDQLAAGAAYVATLRDYWVAASELDGLLEGAPPRGSGSSRDSSSAGTALSMSTSSTSEAH
jgi:cobalt-zinc-cadmium efflux system outer membrane protein